MDLNGYSKLFGSIVASTIWRESKETKIVWITMLAIKDKDGHVFASIPGLADLARVTVEECEASLRVLMSPDPYSRSKESEGRRIAEIDGGWVILNHHKHRDKMCQEERREYLAHKKRESRSGDSVVTTSTATRGGYVYYAVDGNLCKIGFSKNPWSRVHEFKVSNPRIQLAAVEAASFEVEAIRHKQFESQLTSGEWFRFEGELKMYVELLRSNTDLLRSNTTSTTSTHTDTDTDTDKKDIGSVAVAPPTSEEIIREFQLSPAYKGIDVRREFEKMSHWCKVNHKQPTKRRFVNWLNRAEAPIQNITAQVGAARRMTPAGGNL